MLHENENRIRQIIKDKETHINQLRNDIENLSEILWREDRNNQPITSNY